jgi:hypothetical protein
MEQVPSSDDIDATTLVARILDPEGRRALFDAIIGAQGTSVALASAYARAAPIARATADELRRVVAILVAEGRERWAEDFLRHPAMPEEVLLDLCERALCVGALGHLSSPRALVERMVELHAYPEAVITLALRLYRDPAEPLAAFAAHARAHASAEWMLRSLAEVDASDTSKEAVYEDLLIESAAASAFHARHLARSARADAARLASFLAHHRDPRALLLLLRTEIADHDKRAVVIRLAEMREDCPEIADALALRRSCEAARARDLGPETAAELFEAQRPDVLLALAGNPRTPRPLLERLAAHHSAPLARAIRARSSKTLRHPDDPE